MSQLGLSDSENTTVRQAVDVPPKYPAVITARRLQVCEDCGGTISLKANTCPHCGRVYTLGHGISVYGKNWSWRIAGGVILGYFGIIIINIILLIIGFSFFASLFANAANQIKK